jgi:hypothetical protein
MIYSGPLKDTVVSVSETSNIGVGEFSDDLALRVGRKSVRDKVTVSAVFCRINTYEQTIFCGNSKTNLLARVILHLQLNARTLSSYNHPTHHLPLYPNLPMLTHHHDSLRLLSPYVILTALHDLYILPTGNQPLLAFPVHTDTGTELVFDRREICPEADGWGRGGR